MVAPANEPDYRNVINNGGSMSEKKEMSRSTMTWTIAGAILIAGFFINEQQRVDASYDPYAKCETLWNRVVVGRGKCRAEVAVYRLTGDIM